MLTKTEWSVYIIIPIGKGTEKARDRGAIRKWWKKPIMWFAFGTEKAEEQGQP